MIFESILILSSLYFSDSVIDYYVSDESTRYFILHILFNLYIIILCFNTFCENLFYPLNIFDTNYDRTSILSTVSIMNFHLYHTITHVKEMSNDTMIHHLVGAILNPILTVFQPIGKFHVMHNIILCGIPGFVDYILLVTVKFKFLHKIKEKELNRYLNLLIRWPFVFLSDYIYILNIYNGNIKLNTVMTIGIIINNINAIYYCDKVIGNYYLSKEKFK